MASQAPLASIRDTIGRLEVSPPVAFCGAFPQFTVFRVQSTPLPASVLMFAFPVPALPSMGKWDSWMPVAPPPDSGLWTCVCRCFPFCLHFGCSCCISSWLALTEAITGLTKWTGPSWLLRPGRSLSWHLPPRPSFWQRKEQAGSRPLPLAPPPPATHTQSSGTFPFPFPASLKKRALARRNLDLDLLLHVRRSSTTPTHPPPAAFNPWPPCAPVQHPQENRREGRCITLFVYFIYPSGAIAVRPLICCRRSIDRLAPPSARGRSVAHRSPPPVSE